jgi:DNA polymerase-3 subunit delta
MDALAFLAQTATDVRPLYVLHGDEAFLKRQVLRAIRQRALGPDADDQAVSLYAGDRAGYAEVFDELDTVPFFEPRRVVVIESADPFVTRFRADLEKKVAGLSATGTLVLDVKAWPANTRLAKLVDAAATVVCKAPAAFKLPAWCSEWAKSRYRKQLPAPAASLLVDLVGAEMGQLDQELLKLAVFVGDRPGIDVADVDKLVGNSRAENTWKIFDAVGAGDVRAALAMLHRLFEQGEEPMRLLGAFSSQLRRLAQAYRLTAQGHSPAAALEKAGVPPFALRGAEQQMRHLGRRRLERLYDWLLELSMDLRGNSPLPERALFERFLIRLARKNEPVGPAR